MKENPTNKKWLCCYDTAQIKPLDHWFATDYTSSYAMQVHNKAKACKQAQSQGSCNLAAGNCMQASTKSWIMQISPRIIVWRRTQPQWLENVAMTQQNLSPWITEQKHANKHSQGSCFVVFWSLELNEFTNKAKICLRMFTNVTIKIVPQTPANNPKPKQDSEPI